MEDTGERLVPDAAHGTLIYAEHLARYMLAAGLAPGARVLDAACGEGYGTALLRDAGAREAVGVDIDAETVEHARRRHDVDAREGDVLDLPLETASFDLVVSFETIEHVEDPARAFDELRRVTAPGGALLISTPNPRVYHAGNPFHRRELDPDEFHASLAERYHAVTPLYQQNFLASVVLDAAQAGAHDPRTDLGLGLRKTVAVAPGAELYSLALCAADGAPPRLPGRLAVAAAVDEAHRLADELDAVRDECRQRVERAEKDAAHAWDQVAVMTASRSWRLTRPLRALRRG